MLEQGSVAHRRLILCSCPEETCSFLRGQMDLLYDSEMSLALEGHARCDPFLPIHKHTVQCVPQFTSEIQFLFPKHLFFQADQNKSFGNRAILKLFNHINILTLAPLPSLEKI